MSKLNELINKLCPTGVKYKNMGDMCQIRTGKLNANAKDDDGKYPFFTCDANPYRINEYAFDTSAILISGNGSQVGHINSYEGKFNAYQRTYVLDEFKHVEKAFLFHYMRAYLKEYIMVNCKKGSVPYITLPMLQNFEVPVPPLEVQREIVRILDSFTLLTAELTAELTARKKQYEFYRNQLLSFDTKVERKKLGDIFDFRNGLSKGKEFFGRGIPFIRYTDVYNHRALRKEDITALVECTPDEMNKLRVNRGDVLFTRTSETAEDIGWSSVMLADLEECVFNGFTIKATPKTNDLLPEYCAYCFSTYSFRDFVTRKCAFTTRASLTGNTIGEYEMAIPSHEVQKVYRVWVKGYTSEAMEALKRPVVLDGYQISVPKVEFIRNENTRTVLEVTIHEGRNRQVRRMCQYAGMEVTRLRRVSEGAIQLGTLRPGQWRYLTNEEVRALNKD